MDKLVESFRKAARLVVVICLFILAAFQIVALFNDLGQAVFMMNVYVVLRTVLLLLLYLVPAILLAVKKDKEGLITLSFLLGYLVLSTALNFLSTANFISSNFEALVVIRAIFWFILGVLFAVAIIFLLIDKGFGTKLMKLGNVLLVVSLIVMFVAIIIDLICTIVSENQSFGAFFNRLALELISPLIIVFGLILVGDK